MKTEEEFADLLKEPIEEFIKKFLLGFQKLDVSVVSTIFQTRKWVVDNYTQQQLKLSYLKLIDYFKKLNYQEENLELENLLDIVWYSMSRTTIDEMENLYSEWN